MTNPESSSSRSDSDLFEDVVIIFKKSIDLSTADDKIIEQYVDYKFQIYKKSNIQDTTLLRILKEEFSDFIENH